MHQTAQAALDTAQAGLLERAMSLLTDHVLTLLALALVGILVGIASMYPVRIFLPVLHDAPRREREERALVLKRWAFVVGSVWSAVILNAYILAWLDVGVTISLVASIGLAIVAGAATPKAYDLLRSAWWEIIVYVDDLRAAHRARKRRGP